MTWEKLSDKEWRAEGCGGTFHIKRERGRFWGSYASKTSCKMFRMPPKGRVSDAKRMCEDNAYWED